MKHLALRKIITVGLLLSLTACASNSTSSTAVEKLKRARYPHSLLMLKRKNRLPNINWYYN